MKDCAWGGDRLTRMMDSSDLHLHAKSLVYSLPKGQIFIRLLNAGKGPQVHSAILSFAADNNGIIIAYNSNVKRHR